eukprot:2394824-Alexandrium_andersonii.AAC.1
MFIGSSAERRDHISIPCFHARSIVAAKEAPDHAGIISRLARSGLLNPGKRSVPLTVCGQPDPE